MCPYCNNEMLNGYLQSTHDIFWSKKRHKLAPLLSFTLDSDDLCVADGGFTVASVQSQYCPKCKKIILDYK